MINYMSEKLANILIHYLPSESNRYFLLKYGVSIALYTLISTIGLITIGCLFGEMVSSIIIIGIFYLNQTFGGGVHARSHIACFLIMSTFLSITLLLCRIIIPPLVLLGISLISILLLLRMPVVMHANKSYLAPKTAYFTIIARRVLFLESFFCIILYFLHIFPASIGYALLLSALSRFIAILQHKYSKDSVLL